ncbi:MAG: LytTR family DNA-binding domain-containing protein [Christensenella sp.]|uniref:LytR/AlgR family response regulator transcription factor n=1 Tax=Christensenella sp. TaxID=1935934 RepID=UPI002B20C80B|nr:LytTR family DNA-binding domain-containing protein [Christensenella sp.]MEA5004752.1 LytTR family DNA-binding domain-containing protein [Christensenella sp.]
MQILICDDDTLYMAQCQSQLQKLAVKHKVETEVQLTGSGRQLLFLSDNKLAKLDLIYLDHHMPGMSGMETARELRERGIWADIVFYTIDESQVLNAFDVEALHFIVKNKTSDEKFEQIFLKAVERSRRRNIEVISLSCVGDHKNIPIRDIMYFEVMNRIVTVHFNEGNKRTLFEFYSPLSKIEEFLFGKGFLRIHNSYLVAEKYVNKKISKESR